MYFSPWDHHKQGRLFVRVGPEVRRLTRTPAFRYARAFLDRGAEAISSRASGSEQLRRPARKGREIYSAEVFAVS